MMTWIELACVVAVIGAISMVTVRRTVRANRLGSVSAHWIAEYHIQQRS
jgi:hypothetical protein